MVADSFGLPKNLSTSQTLASAYALQHPATIADLEKIAQGCLKEQLLLQLPVGLRQWQPGDAMSTYFQDFKVLLPNVAEHFKYLMLTTTPLEQRFTCASSQMNTNNTSVKNASKMYHLNNVSQHVKRNMAPDVFKARNRRKDPNLAVKAARHRPLRSLQSRKLYHAGMSTLIDSVVVFDKNETAPSKNKKEIQFNSESKYSEAELNKHCMRQH